MFGIILNKCFRLHLSFVSLIHLHSQLPFCLAFGNFFFKRQEKLLFDAPNLARVRMIESLHATSYHVFSILHQLFISLAVCSEESQSRVSFLPPTRNNKIVVFFVPVIVHHQQTAFTYHHVVST